MVIIKSGRLLRKNKKSEKKINTLLSKIAVELEPVYSSYKKFIKNNNAKSCINPKKSKVFFQTNIPPVLVRFLFKSLMILLIVCLVALFYNSYKVVSTRLHRELSDSYAIIP